MAVKNLKMKAARAGMDLSQEELAELVGVTRQTVSYTHLDVYKRQSLFMSKSSVRLQSAIQDPHMGDRECFKRPASARSSFRALSSKLTLVRVANSPFTIRRSASGERSFPSDALARPMRAPVSSS